MKNLVVGICATLLVLSVIIFVAIALASQGQKALLEQSARNGETVVESSKSLRCLLTLKPNPERSYPKTQVLIDECYRRFDELVKESP